MPLPVRQQRRKSSPEATGEDSARMVRLVQFYSKDALDGPARCLAVEVPWRVPSLESCATELVSASCLRFELRVSADGRLVGWEVRLATNTSTELDWDECSHWAWDIRRTIDEWAYADQMSLTWSDADGRIRTAKDGAELNRGVAISACMHFVSLALEEFAAVRSLSLVHTWARVVAAPDKSSLDGDFVLTKYVGFHSVRDYPGDGKVKFGHPSVEGTFAYINFDAAAGSLAALARDPASMGMVRDAVAASNYSLPPFMKDVLDLGIQVQPARVPPEIELHAPRYAMRDVPIQRVGDYLTRKAGAKEMQIFVDGLCNLLMKHSLHHDDVADTLMKYYGLNLPKQLGNELCRYWLSGKGSVLRRMEIAEGLGLIRDLVCESQEVSSIAGKSVWRSTVSFVVDSDRRAVSVVESAPRRQLALSRAGVRAFIACTELAESLMEGQPQTKFKSDPNSELANRYPDILWGPGPVAFETCRLGPSHPPKYVCVLTANGRVVCKSKPHLYKPEAFAECLEILAGMPPSKLVRPAVVTSTTTADAHPSKTSIPRERNLSFAKELLNRAVVRWQYEMHALVNLASLSDDQRRRLKCVRSFLVLADPLRKYEMDPAERRAMEAALLADLRRTAASDHPDARKVMHGEALKSLFGRSVGEVGEVAAPSRRFDSFAGLHGYSGSGLIEELVASKCLRRNHQVLALSPIGVSCMERAFDASRRPGTVAAALSQDAVEALEMLKLSLLHPERASAGSVVPVPAKPRTS